MSRWIVMVVFSAAIAWAGYWWVGARSHQAAWTAWLDARTQDGWSAKVEDLQVRGFPNRFDTILQGLHLNDPHRDWAWQAPEMSFLSLSYRPSEVIAVWPQHQSVMYAGRRIGIVSQELKASIALHPSHSLPLTRMILEGRGVDLAETGGAQIAITDLIATLTREDQATYDAGIQAKGVTLSSTGVDEIAALTDLPGAIDVFRLRFKAEFHRPWDLPAIEGQTPQLQRIEITDFAVEWGKFNLQAKGALTYDGARQPSGRLELSVENWQEMLPVLIAANVVPKSAQNAVETGLGLLARMSGDAKTLEVPLSITQGQMYLGPLALGPLPSILGAAQP